MPRLEDINTDGLEARAREMLEHLLEVDLDELGQQLPQVEEHLARFGDRLPERAPGAARRAEAATGCRLSQTPKRPLYERIAVPLVASRAGSWFYVNVAPHLDRGLLRLTDGRWTTAGRGRVGFPQGARRAYGQGARHAAGLDA